jgi:hypothetical protein
MAKHPRVQRLDVLGAANKAGWQHDTAVFDNGDIVRDLFTGDAGVIRCVWIRTPWSSDGRWAGAVFSDARTRTDHNLWTLAARRGLLELLRSGRIQP